MVKENVIYNDIQWNTFQSLKKKEGNPAICNNNMNELGKHYAKWNKSDRKINATWYHLYVESKKMIQMKLFTKQK